MPDSADPRPAPVALLDPVARALRVDHATLGAAAVVLAGDPVPPPAAAAPHLAALAAAGAISDGSLEPWVAEVVATIAAAPVEITVEVFSAGRMAATTLWSDGPWGAVAAHHGDDTLTVRPLPGSLLAATIADLVGLDPTRTAPSPLPLRGLPAAALHRFHARLVTGDAPGAVAALTAEPDVVTEELEVMLDLVTGRGRSWRVSAGPTRVVVVDAARRGLWLAVGPSPAAITPIVDDLVLSPTTPATVWRQLLALLPPTGASPLSAVDPETPPCPEPAPFPNSSSPTRPPPASAA